MSRRMPQQQKHEVPGLDLSQPLGSVGSVGGSNPPEARNFNAKANIPAKFANTGGIAGRIHADHAHEAKLGYNQPGKIGRINGTQRLRDEAMSLKGEAAGASAARRQEIGRRIVALTAELEIVAGRWTEDKEKLPTSFKPVPKRAAAALPNGVAEKQDGRSFFRSNAEYGLMNYPGLNLPRGMGQRQQPRHGRRAARRGIGASMERTMHLASTGDVGMGASLSDVEARERQQLLQRQYQRPGQREDVATKAFHAGQGVVRGHAPNHHLEPTLGYRVPTDVDAIAAERRIAMEAAAAPPRQTTPLAGQTQIISRGSLHTPSVRSVPGHTKYFGRNQSVEVKYAEAVFKATGYNPHVGRPTATSPSGPI